MPYTGNFDSLEDTNNYNLSGDSSVFATMDDFLSAGKSFDEYYNYYHGSNPGSFISRIGNFFTGDLDRARNEYQLAFDKMSLSQQQQYEYEYNRMLRQTEFADFVKSATEAGFNPYYLIGQGANAGGSYSTTTSAMKYSNDKKSSKGGSAAIAGLLYAIGRIIAAIVAA